MSFGNVHPSSGKICETNSLKTYPSFLSASKPMSISFILNAAFTAFPPTTKSSIIQSEIWPFFRKNPEELFIEPLSFETCATSYALDEPEFLRTMLYLIFPSGGPIMTSVSAGSDSETRVVVDSSERRSCTLEKCTSVTFCNGSVQKHELLLRARGLEPHGLEPGPPGAPKPST